MRSKEQTTMWSSFFKNAESGLAEGNFCH